jgi:anti-sigma-K factor RskA
MEQATAYVFGALGDPDREGFERDLANSTELQAEVAELRNVAGLLALAVPPVAPPPRLRDRVLAEARAVRPIAAHRAEAQRRDEDRPLHVVAGGAAERPLRVSRFVPWLAVAASLVGVVVARNQVREQADARASLAMLSDSMRVELASKDSVINALLAPDVQTVKLVATGQPLSARMYWNRESNQVVFVTFALPPAASGRTYQLWGIERGKRPVSLGTFNTSGDGSGRLTARVPEGVRIAVGAVTDEPAGGSPQPTTTPFLMGEFRAAE